MYVIFRLVQVVDEHKCGNSALKVAGDQRSGGGAFKGKASAGFLAATCRHSVLWSAVCMPEGMGEKYGLYVVLLRRAKDKVHGRRSSRYLWGGLRLLPSNTRTRPKFICLPQILHASWAHGWRHI